MNKKKDEIQSIVSMYVNAAKSYGDAIGKGDHINANKAHSVLNSTFLKLCDLESGEAVLPLFADENLAVRYSAAVDALKVSPHQAELVLERVVNGPPSSIRLMAQITLSEWRTRKE